MMLFFQNIIKISKNLIKSFSFLFILIILVFSFENLSGSINKYFPSTILNNNSIDRFNIKDTSFLSAKMSVNPSTSGLKELNTVNLDLNYHPINNLATGLRINSLNNELFNKYSISSGISYIYYNTSITGFVDFNNIKIKNYSSSNYIAFGLSGELNFDEVSAGFVLNNLNKGRFIDSSISNDNFLLLYLNYAVLDNLKLTLGFFQEFSKVQSFNFGLEYKPIEMINMYLGYNLNPKIISYGINIRPIRNFGLNINYLYHTLIGLEQSYGIAYYY